MFSSITARRRRKSCRRPNDNYNDMCKFLTCADQLMKAGSSTFVRVLRVNDDTESNEQCPNINVVPSPVIPLAVTSNNTKTMIITATSFTTIPSVPSPKRNTIYVKPLIVLDLNGILCHRVREANQSTMHSSQISTLNCTSTRRRYRASVGRIANTEIIPRSDLMEFLQFLHQHFALSVWTSATSKTARSIVKVLFPEDIRNKLVFVWHRSSCNLVKNDEIDHARKKIKRRRGNDNLVTKSNAAVSLEPNHPTNNHQHDMIAIKSLSKVWSTYPIWDETNTLLLDDSPDKCPRRHRGNAIHPFPLCGTENLYNDDAPDFDLEVNNTCTSDDIVSREEPINEDEENQKLQRQFFELLAEHWSSPQTRVIDTSLDGTVYSRGTSLNEFLKEHANVHNMRWEEE